MTGNAKAALLVPAFALLVGLSAPWAPSEAAGALAPGSVPAAQEKSAPSAAAQPTPAAPKAPVSIPVPEIVKGAESVGRVLRDLEALAEPPPALELIQARLPGISARLGPEQKSTIETLKQQPAGTIVDRLEQSWRANRLEVIANVEVLTGRATQLEQGLDQLASLRATWAQTRAEAQTSRAPAAVVQRVNAVLTDIEAARARLQAQRVATLVLQDLVGQDLARCDDSLALINRYRQQAWTRIFARTTPPIWSLEEREPSVAELPGRVREAAIASITQLRQFAHNNAVPLFLQAVVFLGLLGLARAAGRQSRVPGVALEEALPGSALFDRPYSSAALAGLALTIWMFPTRPRVVTDTLGIVLLLPVLRVVRPLVGPALAPALYGLAVLCLFDRVRANLAVVPVADQVLLVLDMVVVVAGLTWLLASGRLGRAPEDEPIQRQVMVPVQRAIAFLALAVAATALAAAAFGAMGLARMLGANLLLSAFVTVEAYGALQVADGLFAFALRVWPLRGLGMVARHRGFLERRGHLVLCGIVAVTWLGSTLRFIGVWDQALGLVETALAAEVRRGTMSISLGDVLAFLLVVWLAFIFSAAIRFVLEEDVYPRLRLARGVPYVISSLLHYVILLLGFLLALAMLGVDFNKVTVLAGAFGVGIGFGLQGAVNNFVSGLIVLLERPVNVGDAIQLGELSGEVRGVGIRATTVRTWEGADVIVPNAHLVSEKVTNWTHRDQMRRLDLSVGVAYGCEPRKVLELLLTVARAHPDVLAEPAPQAFFRGFGESALQFELFAWTRRFSRWGMVRSELGVALYEALCEAGVEIPFPQREVHLRDGGATAGTRRGTT